MPHKDESQSVYSYPFSSLFFILFRHLFCEYFDKENQTLLRFQEKNLTKASFLMILSGSEVAYQRTDGVLVIPLGCLKN